MSDPKFFTCSYCGYEWSRGQNGQHSCEGILKKQLEINNQLLVEWIQKAWEELNDHE